MRKITLLAAVAVLSLISSCRPSAEKYVDFLYESMPLPDSLVHPREYWEANVRKTLEVRERMGWNVPEREFRHFVLPLRVNNENLDDFRTYYADSLCDRVEGMSMAEAALEVNHWCHERATYTPSDGRTIGPMALIKSGLGRCGEESVLAVSALRAAGIPARQVYTPRWAHTDDNHAWVEVYVDGKWHFMGACEPEPVLDLAWFNASVSRAMLLHTKVTGDYDGPEDVISKTECYTEINCIKSYIPTRRTNVTVKDTEGNTVSGATVEFRIYNYGEFYKVASYISDREGRASLDTGLGDIVVWAFKDGRFGLSVASGDESEVVLDKTIGERYSLDLEIVPPVENPLPNLATEEEAAENVLRLAYEDSLRTSRPHPRTIVPELFLSKKDEIDITDEMVEDGLVVRSEDPYVASPRVEIEMLMPYRREILASAIRERLNSPSEIVSWVKDSITISTTGNPQRLRIPPVAVWRSKISDAKSRDIFFVALCRTLGYAARLDEATSKPEYRAPEGWISVDFEKGTEVLKPKKNLVLEYVPSGEGAIKNPEYYYHYTISKIENGSPRLCEYDEYAPSTFSYNLEEGYYMVVSGTRLASGAVLAHVETATLESDLVLPLVLRTPLDEVRVIGTIDGEKLLPYTGRGYYMVCITGLNDEPTIHAINDLEAMAPELNVWGRKVLIYDGKAPEGLENAILLSDDNGEIRDMILKGIEYEGPVRLPIIIIADSFGRVVYFTSGYNTSLQSQLSFVLGKL